VLIEWFAWHVVTGLEIVLFNITSAAPVIPTVDMTAAVILMKSFDYGLPVTEWLGFASVYIAITATLAAIGTVRVIKSFFPFFF
jgi:hypothetical protein